LREQKQLSLSHLQALPEHHRSVTGLTTTSRRAESGKVLCLVDDFDQTVFKRLQERGRRRVTKSGPGLPSLSPPLADIEEARKVTTSEGVPL